MSPRLSYEIGQIENDKREFVISANGLQYAFTQVEDLYSIRPELSNWKFTKLKPRKETIDSITIEDITLNSSDIRYMFFEDDNPKKIGTLLLIDNFENQNYNLYSSFAFVFLDQALGEYDVATYIGVIDIVGFDSVFFDKSKEIEKMPQEFDLWKSKNLTKR